MILCDKCHIVFDEKYCPLCVAKEDIENLQKEIDNLQNEVDDLVNTSQGQ